MEGKQNDNPLGWFINVETQAIVNFGRGASFNNTGWIANDLSDGADCTVSSTGIFNRGLQILGVAATVVATDGVAAGGNIPTFLRGISGMGGSTTRLLGAAADDALPDLISNGSTILKAISANGSGSISQALEAMGEGAEAFSAQGPVSGAREAIGDALSRLARVLDVAEATIKGAANSLWKWAKR